VELKVEARADILLIRYLIDTIGRYMVRYFGVARVIHGF
jgi:hypothetical protein